MRNLTIYANLYKINRNYFFIVIVTGNLIFDLTFLPFSIAGSHGVHFARDLFTALFKYSSGFSFINVLIFYFMKAVLIFGLFMLAGYVYMLFSRFIVFIFINDCNSSANTSCWICIIGVIYLSKVYTRCFPSQFIFLLYYPLN